MASVEFFCFIRNLRLDVVQKQKGLLGRTENVIKLSRKWIRRYCCGKNAFYE